MDFRTWVGVVGVAVGVGVGAVIIDSHFVDKGETPKVAASNSLPVEYVYLDSARIDAYLGELQNGIAPSEKRSLSNSSSTTLGLNAATYLSLNTAVSSTQSAEGTVTPDEGDRFYQLLNQLLNNYKSEFNQIDLTTDRHPSGELRNVHDGNFVELIHARLEMPLFSLPVPPLSLGTEELLTVSGHREQRIRASTISSLIANHPKQVKKYLLGFGRNPTFPLTVYAPYQLQGAPRCHPAHPTGVDEIRVPVLLSGLLDSPALLGGGVTILGKVVRQIRIPAPQRTPYDVVDSDYFDTSSAIASERAVLNAPPAVVQTLRLPSIRAAKLSRAARQRAAHISRAARISLVQQSEDLCAPGTVVLPIAIYT